MNGSPPDSLVPGIFQAKILEQFAISSSRGSSLSRDRSHVSCFSCIGRWILYHWATWKALFKCDKCPVFTPGIRAQMPSCGHPDAIMHTSRNSPSFLCSIPMAHQWFIFREQEAMLVCHHFLNNFFPLCNEFTVTRFSGKEIMDANYF